MQNCLQRFGVKMFFESLKFAPRPRIADGPSQRRDGIEQERTQPLAHQRLAKLQTQLGDFHDACVSLRTLDRYSKRAEIPTAKALAKLRTRQQKQRDRLRALIHEHGISELRQLIRKKSLREIFGDAI